MKAWDGRQAGTCYVILLLELNGFGPLPVDVARRAQFTVVVLREVTRVHLHALDVLPHAARVAADHEAVIVREPTASKGRRGGHSRPVGDRVSLTACVCRPLLGVWISETTTPDRNTTSSLLTRCTG